MRWEMRRTGREGRRGWELSLPRFEDADRPEDARRMNRFYDTAEAEMTKAAQLASETDARRVRYKCEAQVLEIPDRPDECGGKTSSPRRSLRELLRKKADGKDEREAGTPGDIRVSLRLTLAISGQWTREKTIVHLWRRGVLVSSRALL